MYPFVEVVLFYLGLTWMGHLTFVPGGVHLWGLCLLGVGLGNLFGRVLPVFWGFCIVFNGGFVYHYRGMHCLFNGGNGSKGVPKSGCFSEGQSHDRVLPPQVLTQS